MAAYKGNHDMPVFYFDAQNKCKATQIRHFLFEILGGYFKVFYFNLITFKSY